MFRRSSRRSRLVVESLEGRWAPALLTSTSLTDSAFGSPTYGQAITFTASVTSNGSPVTEGKINFSADGTPLASGVSVDSFGHAIFTTTTPLAMGFHAITATYNDTSSNYLSSSGSDNLTVSPAQTVTVLQTPATTVAFGAPVGLIAGVTSPNTPQSPPTGSVAFFDGGTMLATAQLSGGSAGYTTSALSRGVHSLSAIYLGDALHDSSTSARLSVTIGTPSSGVISGIVFHDYNVNGVQDPGEPGLAGQTLFLDLDASGLFKASDPTATTDGDGHYQFTGLADGTYTVREVLPGAGLLSSPASGSYQVTVSNGGSITGQNFADVLTSIAVPLTLPPTTPFPAQGSPNADYVEALYRSILNRNADAGGLASWTSQLNSGAVSRLQVVQGIRNSPEHFTQEITAIYQTLLGRTPDPAGLQSWVQQLEGGMKEEQITFYFLDSPEYLSQGDKHFADAMYLSLLGRSSDSAGEASWLNQLATGTLTHEQVITDFLYSTESLTRLTEGYYEVFLQRQADSAGLNGWVGALQQGTPFLTIGQQFLSSDEFYNKAAAQG